MSSADNRGSIASSGRLVVLAMVGLAIAAAIFAWWWNFERGQRALALYGPQTATLIRKARTVEIFVPPSAKDRSSPGSNGEAARPTTRQIDISRAPGLLNARTSLLDDASYAWKKDATQSSAGDYVLIRFVDDNDQAMLRIDFESGAVSLIPEGGQATLIKKTTEGWRSFIARCVEKEQSPPEQ